MSFQTAGDLYAKSPIFVLSSFHLIHCSPLRGTRKCDVNAFLYQQSMWENWSSAHRFIDYPCTAQGVFLFSIQQLPDSIKIAMFSASYCSLSLFLKLCFPETNKACGPAYTHIIYFLFCITVISYKEAVEDSAGFWTALHAIHFLNINMFTPNRTVRDDPRGGTRSRRAPMAEVDISGSSWGGQFSMNTCTFVIEY